MSKTRGGPARNLPAFSRWLKAWLTDTARADGISVRKLLEDRKVNRANIIRWQTLTRDMSGPTRETVDREFDRLKISAEERVEPYGFLGWNVGADEEETLTSLEGKLRRVNAILRMRTLTPEQRAKYEAIKESAETSAEALMDRIINDFERDEAQSGE